MSLESEIVRILEQTKTDIRNQMAAKGVNASGRTSKSLHVKRTKQSLQLVGGGTNAAPFPTLEIGRPGGNVPQGFYYIIKQWTRDKGLSFSTESERGTFAYFVARKIADEGTRRHKAHLDVYSTISKNAVASIHSVVSDSVNKSIYKAIHGDVSAVANTNL